MDRKTLTGAILAALSRPGRGGISKGPRFGILTRLRGATRRNSSTTPLSMMAALSSWRRCPGRCRRSVSGRQNARDGGWRR